MASSTLVSFDFTELEDIDTALSRCAVGSRGLLIGSSYLAPLRRLAEQLGATRTALRNAEHLATGFEDLVVILLEPSDMEDEMFYEDIIANRGAPILHIDNTIVIDVRPFRSNKIRRSEGEETRRRNDQAAYRTVQEVLDLLHPKVMVICHCDKDGLTENMKYLGSSPEKAGTVSLQMLNDGQKVVRIPSVHPMYFARTEKGLSTQRFRKQLFDATFVIAANALAGRRVSGLGMDSLRIGAQHGAYYTPGPGDFATPKLIEQFRKMGLWTAEDELSEDRRLVFVKDKPRPRKNGILRNCHSRYLAHAVAGALQKRARARINESDSGSSDGGI
ncbi:hypothetical protein PG994_015197 [Apiospora phragmitis]|uniref:Uncharacterized protein n=1 Tax=Apiospora phragmitis TaxID=2905665 RepID=A0ABR1SVT0_9PEZI